MDSILQNNQVRIYSAYYVNGEYTSCKDKLYDSYSTTAHIDATGCTGCTGPNIPDSRSTLYNARNLSGKVYKAYKVQIAPSENTQESYDDVVNPFVNLDDIGTRIKLIDPVINTVRLDINPGRLDDVVKLHAENEKISTWNKLITPFFEKIESFVLAEEQNTDDQIINALEQQINDCNPEYQREVISSISKMISDFRRFHTEKVSNVSDDQYEDIYWSDGEIDPPQYYDYCKYQKIIPNDWYDYRHDVIFNGTTKLYIDCHEFTKTYAMIDNFLNGVKDL